MLVDIPVQYTVPVNSAINFNMLKQLSARIIRYNDDFLAIVQAVAFIEDAVRYRSIFHKIDGRSLRIYQCYYSLLARWTVHLAILAILGLAFFEFPSSMSPTADLKQPGQSVGVVVPCGITEAIELICWFIFLLDLLTKSYIIGTKRLLNSPWLFAYGVVLSVYLCDWCVSVALMCQYSFRIRRLIRPFFLLQNSSMMKKTFDCIRRTLPEVFSVLMLLFLHLYFFSLFGMLLFKDVDKPGSVKPSPSDEGVSYFYALNDSVLSLLVLLTTANNPDVMMPAYDKHRLSALFFILFVFIGTFCCLNMLTAVIFNQFRGYLLNSMGSSLRRRRLAVLAAFWVLSRDAIRLNEVAEDREEADWDCDGDRGDPPIYYGVPTNLARTVVVKATMPAHSRAAILRELDTASSHLTSRRFSEILSLLDSGRSVRDPPPIRWATRPLLLLPQRVFAHSRYIYFSLLVSLLNVICMSVLIVVRQDEAFGLNNSALLRINALFTVWYVIELPLRIASLGPRKFFYTNANTYDCIVTLGLFAMGCWYVIAFVAQPHLQQTSQSASLYFLTRFLNMLILLRLLRLIPHVSSMSLVASSMLDLFSNMRPFAGILIIVYYIFAVLGVALFEGVVQPPANVSSIVYECGSFEQLNYWGNNFNEFSSALVVLWDVMVVNNWGVFLKAFSRFSGPWSQLYFVAWWLVSVIVGVNLFVALILENFVCRWDRWSQQRRGLGGAGEPSEFGQSIHEVFRGSLVEPDEHELRVELASHAYLKVPLPSRQYGASAGGDL